MQPTNVIMASPQVLTALRNPPAEPLSATLKRWGLNFFPAFFATGARATYFDGNFREIHIELPLTWRTRNYVGTIFGGSMFAAIDPIYMFMLFERLDREFIVWDKSGTIHFKKPGTKPLKARFHLSDELVEEIRNEALKLGRAERTFLVDLIDASGIVHARAEKTLVIKAKPRG